jgi:hypothetical protein
VPRRHNPLKPKTIHRGTHVNEAGGVKALCFDVPRSIDLTRATWAMRDQDVTCPKCLRIIASAKLSKVATP